MAHLTSLTSLFRAYYHSLASHHRSHGNLRGDALLLPDPARTFELLEYFQGAGGTLHVNPSMIRSVFKPDRRRKAHAGPRHTTVLLDCGTEGAIQHSSARGKRLSAEACRGAEDRTQPAAMAVVDEAVLDLVREHMGSVRTPQHHDKVCCASGNESCSGPGRSGSSQVSA